jgi:hypothetical protein
MSSRSPSAPDLYACRYDNGLLILDLSCGKYYAINRRDLDSETTTAFLTTHHVKTHSALVNVALLQTLPMQEPESPHIGRHLSALFRATLKVVVTNALFGAPAAIYNLRSFKNRSSGVLRPPSHPGFATAARAFRNIRPLLYTAHQRCLLDALILTNYLLSLRYDAQFVIGVRAQPFEAHAWTQSGNYLIEDFRERVQWYTPILVV